MTIETVSRERLNRLVRMIGMAQKIEVAELKGDVNLPNMKLDLFTAKLDYEELVKSEAAGEKPRGIASTYVAKIIIMYNDWSMHPDRETFVADSYDEAYGMMERYLVQRLRDDSTIAKIRGDIEDGGGTELSQDYIKALDNEMDADEEEELDIVWEYMEDEESRAVDKAFEYHLNKSDAMDWDDAGEY
jgi:hypothetical protein